MKTHYSIAELLELDLFDLPKTRKGLDKYLTRNNWQYKEVPSRGKGGTKREYFLPEEFTKKVLLKDIKSEVYTLIVWDKVNKDFFIHVPHQEVSGATVKYTNNVEIYNNPDYLVYCDFH